MVKMPAEILPLPGLFLEPTAVTSACVSLARTRGSWALMAAKKVERVPQKIVHTTNLNTAVVLLL